MKPSYRIALMLTLSAALLSASALAQTGTAPAAAPAAAPATAPAAPAAASVPADADVLPPAPAKKKAKSSGYSRGTAYYNQCLKENMADAEHFCATHSDGCEAEKAGVAKQCKSEARGERQKG